MIFNWISIGIGTHRARVIGGWIVKYEDTFSQSLSISMVFVPDPKHEWEID